MSEGEFVNIRADIPNTKPSEIDESTDAYDTIDWLVKNVANNNGKVGMYGISYPGFYTSAGSIDSHPALKACSPQAPVGGLVSRRRHSSQRCFVLEPEFLLFRDNGSETAGPRIVVVLHKAVAPEHRADGERV